MSFHATQNKMIASPRRKLVVLTLMSLLACWPLPQQAHAAASDLDLTFGNGGKVITDIFGYGDSLDAIALQSDGKIVAAGSAFHPGTSDDFVLVRYQPDGSLDSTFGTGGKVNTDFFGQIDEASAIAIQSNGNIIVAGIAQATSDFASFDFAVARYTNNGSLDPTFGTGGKVTTDFFGHEDAATSIALQPDGKIVVAGRAQTSSSLATLDFALVRYNADGSLDSTFGTGGKTSTDFFGLADEGHALALQTSGKIIVAGFAQTSAVFRNSDFALVRYNSDGSLDSTFGIGGKVTTNFFDEDDQAFAIALQPGGKIVAAGVATNEDTDGDFALARYNADGSLDATFGSGGKTTTDFFGNRDLILAIALQSDGKILAAGFGRANTTDLDFALARYSPDGNLDPGLNSNGKVTMDFFGEADIANSVALQPDGKIIVAGTALYPKPGSSDFALVRYNGDSPLFDVCLQDDRNGNLLQFNSISGDYQFTDCRKRTTFTGRGVVQIRFCKIELRASQPGRTLTALANTCTHAGSAALTITSTPATYSISDSNITDNTCACH